MSNDAPYSLQLDTLREGFDGKTCWVSPEAARVGDPPVLAMGMTRLDIAGSDVFEGTYISWSDDGENLGNFNTLDYDDEQAWVLVAEWMQNDRKGYGPNGADYCARFGSNNAVFVAKINWNGLE